MTETNTIPILEKTVAVVNALASSPEGASAKSLSLGLNIPPATCYRILRTLGNHNWIRADGDGQYRIAFGLAALSRAYSGTEQILRRLASPLRALSEATGLSAKITLREGDQAVTAMRVESRHPNAITSKVGSKMHLAQAGAAGTVLLSALAAEEIGAILRTAPPECWSKGSEALFRKDILRVRKEGISRALGKYHPSIHAISVPLAFPSGQTAALAVFGWPEDFAGAKKAAIEKQLKEYAGRMRV